MPSEAAEGRLAAALSFVAGFVDTLGFVALFGLFTAHVTGNFVLIGATLAQSGDGVVLKLLAFPAFVGAVVLARAIVLARQRRQRAGLRPLLLLQALLLAASALCGIAAAPIVSDMAPLAVWAGVIAAAAMGVQNAAARLVLPALAPTTVMTGNVTQLVIDTTDLLRGAGDAPLRRRAGRLVAPVLCFALGAIAGAYGWLHLGFGALVLPIGLLLALTPATADAPPTR